VCNSQLTRFDAEDRGSAAIEFAILAPAFIALLFATFAVGWAVNAMSAVNFAAERAARSLQLQPTMTQAQITAAIKQEVAYLDNPNILITVSIDNLSGQHKLGRVEAKYGLVIDVPLLGSYPIEYTSAVTVPLLIP
jgi:Flp pilus assembly protein TadG